MYTFKDMPHDTEWNYVGWEAISIWNYDRSVAIHYAKFTEDVFQEYMLRKCLFVESMQIMVF